MPDPADASTKARPVKETNAICDGCGEATDWATADETWALLPIRANNTLDFRTGTVTALAVKAVACQRCGYLRFYDARYFDANH